MDVCYTHLAWCALVIGHFFNSLCSNELIISFNNYLGCLDIFLIISFLVCDFQGTFDNCPQQICCSSNYRMEITRFELVTSCLQGRRSPNWANPPYLIFSTYELFQRSGLKWTLPPQTQVFKSLGLSGLEPPTSRLSGVRSNRLSYKPFFIDSAATYSPTPSPVQYHRPPRS